MKLCTGCRWADDQEYGDWMCHHPQVMSPARRSPVTGEVEEPKPTPCWWARGAEECDAEGKLWEPKGAEPAKPAGFV
jgi:hypothetical protein